MKLLSTTILATAMVVAIGVGAQAQTAPSGVKTDAPNVTSTGPNANAPRPDSDANVKQSTPGMAGASGMSGGAGTMNNQMGAGAGFGTPNVSSGGPEANAPRVDSGASARDTDSGKPPTPGSVNPK